MITGNSTVTGNLAVSGTISGVYGRTYIHCVAFNSLNGPSLQIARTPDASIAMPLNAHRDVQGVSPFNGSNGLFQCTTPGMYLFNARWLGATSFGKYTALLKNGAMEAELYDVRLTHALYLAAGDSVQLRIRHYEDAPINIETRMHVTCTLLSVV